MQAIHAARFGHADLRWPNIIKLTRGAFRVIDLELAVPLDSLQRHRKEDVVSISSLEIRIVGTALSTPPLHAA